MIAIRELRAFMRARLWQILVKQGTMAAPMSDDQLRAKCAQLVSDAKAGRLSDADARLIGDLMTDLMGEAAK